MGHPNPAAGRAVRPVNKSYEKANCKPENICEASYLFLRFHALEGV